MNLGIIILAAGQSSRLGEPKQLLDYSGQPLIRHMAQIAVDLDAGPVVVVVGAHAEAVTEALHDLPVRKLHNPDWQTGMASSIKAGVALLAPTLPDGILILLTDQPHVNRALLEKLIDTARSTHKPIVASQYGDTLGVPILFRSAYFEALQQLSGDAGARVLVQQHIDDVASVPFEEGAVDLDTPEDVVKWKQGET